VILRPSVIKCQALALGVSGGYRRKLLSKSLVNSITSAPNVIVLAPIIQRLPRTAKDFRCMSH
jgi:hypothetical protein